LRRPNFFLLTFLLAIEVISVFCLTSVCLAQPSNTDDSLILVDLRVENQPDSARITIRANRYFEYIDYQLQGLPFGIAFDPTEPIYVNFEKPESPGTGALSGIKFIKSSLSDNNLPSILKEGFYPIDYFVITPDKKTDYRISQRANTIIIDIGQPAQQIAGLAGQLPAVPQAPEVKKIKILEPSDIASDFIKSLGKKPKVKDKPKAKEKKKNKPVIALPPAMARNDVKSPSPGAPMNFQQLRDQIMSKSLSSKGPIVKLPEGKSAFNFNECLEIATSNFVPLIVAEEEMKLGDMKVNEATRGLYPTATAKYAFTDGKALDVEFTEKTYGMQVEQPLYYGGRLKLTLKQAQVNRQVAQAKFDKAEADIVAKITETFYSLATAQLNLNDQKELFAKSRDILALAGKKYEQELITKLELLNVESQANQIEYQLAVAAKDLDIARMNLLQAMNANPEAEITANMGLNYKEHIIDLNNCLYLAYQNRPELHMNELLREAAGYEEKIAKSKDDFQVGFTGFLGQSGSAYKTETLRMGSDWFVGVKASKPLLGNVGSYNFTQNKTSPKLGQSTVTSGSSQSLELGILSNLTGYSEKQSALISKLKSENELIETEKTINTEVREAHNNYEKAVMQIQNTKEKIRFKEEELNVLRSQADINEAMLSQVLDAMVKLNDEKALYHQAIASYKSALANLNKTIGLMNYFN